MTAILAFVAKPDRFLNPDASLKEYLEGLVKLPAAAAADMNPKVNIEKVSRQIALNKERASAAGSDVLNDTMKGIYALPEFGDMIGTAHALLGKENESLRLALLIYARLNGINLKQEDIDKVRETVLDSKDPDLGAFMMHAFTNKERFVTK